MKSDQVTMNKRIEEILQIRLRGALWPDILQHATESGWGVGERQLRTYVARSDEMLADIIEEDREKMVKRHLGQRRVLYAHAFQAGDYNTARNVLKDEAELLGLNAPAKHELTGKDGTPLQQQPTTAINLVGKLSVEELEQLEPIVKKLAELGNG